jgi:beta-lactamase superfamily II metal-dependent hydrolase
VITDSTEDEANKKVLKQLDKKNIPYYRSSVDGTITITGNGSGIYEVTKEE